MVQYGIGLDASLGTSFDEQRALVLEARELGYTSAWTPSGTATRDGFQVCGQWAAATRGEGQASLTTGVAVIPAPAWSVSALASQAGTLSDLSGGQFILGLGTGGAYSAEYRRTYGLAEIPLVSMMRDYLVVLRRLFAGESVTHSGKALKVAGLTVTGQPLAVPLYISALGPQLLRLAGELADGVCLNWSTPEQRAWCRARIAEGAQRVGRDPAEVTLMEYIRVCVDDDPARARRAFARAFMGYALARPGASPSLGYRGHFTRMGFDAELLAIEEHRDAGASTDELADAFSDELLGAMGYIGSAANAADALRTLSEGLDVAVVRLVPAEPGHSAAAAAMRACAPIG